MRDEGESDVGPVDETHDGGLPNAVVAVGDGLRTALGGGEVGLGGASRETATTLRKLLFACHDDEGKRKTMDGRGFI